MARPPTRADSVPLPCSIQRQGMLGSDITAGEKGWRAAECPCRPGQPWPQYRPFHKATRALLTNLLMCLGQQRMTRPYPALSHTKADLEDLPH